MQPESKNAVNGVGSITFPTTQPQTTYTVSGTSVNSFSPTMLVSEPSTRNYLRGSDARDKLMRGVFMVNDAVSPTIGPKGRDALLGAFEWPYSIATNDGASIAEKVKSDDPYEQMGVRLIQEAIGRANKESGDGSTTTCILTASILREGQKYAESTKDFKAELNAALPKILDGIDAQKKEVKPDEVWKVATTSAQDEEMGKLIGDIYKEIGKDGVISWEAAPHDGMTYEVKEGVELRGVTFVHPTFINAGPAGAVLDPRMGDRIVVNNPHILIASEKVQSSAQLEPYVSGLLREGVNEMVLFCDEIDPITLAEIEMTGLGINPRTGGQTRQFKIIVLKAPTLWKDWIYEDFAVMTGATVFGIGQGAQFKGGSSLNWLGKCDKLIAKRGGVDVIGTKDINQHIATLEKAAFDRPDFEKRVEWLNSKAAIVKMGAKSEVELTYKRLKFDDAKNAAKIALKGGIVRGGGLALAGLSKQTDNPILQVALKAPLEKVLENAGLEWKDEYANGFDGRTGEPIDAFEAGIVDPADAIKNAIKAAVSVAGTVLNCSTALPYVQTTSKYN